MENSMKIQEEMILPPDIPSYLSSQGTLSEPPEGYSNSEAGSHQQLMPTANGYVHKGTDGLYMDTGSETDTDVINTTFPPSATGLLGPVYASRSVFHPGEPREGLGQLQLTGSSGPLLICSDCYDNANIYTRTREYCPYACVTEEDSLDHSLSSLLMHIPKDTFPAQTQHEVAALGGLLAERNMSIFLSNHDRIGDQKCNREHFQHQLWENNEDMGLKHAHLPQQPNGFQENRLVVGIESLADKNGEFAVLPRSCQRAHEQDYDLNRTQAVQEYKEAT